MGGVFESTWVGSVAGSLINGEYYQLLRGEDHGAGE